MKAALYFSDADFINSEYIAQLMHAVNASVSPIGERCSTNLPLSTTIIMPAKASSDPKICMMLMREERYTSRTSSVAKSGQEQTISEVLVAVV